MSHTKWKYGDAWEQFPIAPQETWIVDNTSTVQVHNLFEPLPRFMLNADMLFIDPPWNLGNVNTFYTKAGRSDYVDHFTTFENAVFQRITDIQPHTIYIEMGKQNVDRWQERLTTMYPRIQRWQTTYYKKHLCYILRASRTNETSFDYTGWDEADVISHVCANEQYNVIGDFCMGQGLVGVGAYKAGKRFVGTELNQRRLAVLLQRLHKLGARIKKK